MNAPIGSQAGITLLDAVITGAVGEGASVGEAVGLGVGVGVAVGLAVGAAVGTNVEANHALGFPADLRDYGQGAEILVNLGVKKLRLLTNNPKKISGIEGFGLEITERIPIQMNHNERNIRYMKTKKEKMGHLLKFGEEKA